MSTPNPPPEFLDRMRRLLPPDEFEAFVGSYEQPPHTGLRVNTSKISVDDFTSIAPFSLAPVGEWDPAAFLVTGDGRPGRHPYHDAGLYYLQEPSAMVAAAMLAPRPGELVLDLAAAPGGKSTHMAALMDDRAGEARGLLVANDVNAGRARLLADNLARWGATDTLVIQNEPDRLAAVFGPIFDAVLIDAPCSGEGMFRRQPGIEWSEVVVAACARRQGHILTVAPQLVRPGGRLLYATCTFAPEENESVLAAFLAANPDFYIEALPQLPGFAPGRPDWVKLPNQVSDDTALQLSRAVRLWPHRFPGEGHFLARLQRTGDEHSMTAPSFRRRPPTAAERDLWQRFAGSVLTADFPADRLHVNQNRLYALPHQAIVAERLHMLRYGLPLGEFRAGHFRPAHDLALTLLAEETHGAVMRAANDSFFECYLAGEDIPDDGQDGWVLVTVDGYGLGWGKRSNGRLKNHYPRHLRRSIR